LILLVYSRCEAETKVLTDNVMPVGYYHRLMRFGFVNIFNIIIYPRLLSSIIPVDYPCFL